MTVSISSAHNVARLAGTLSYLDTGAGHARVRLYDGTRPAAGGAATTLLAEIALDKPCGAISNNVLVLTSSDIPLIVASGVAMWARVVNGNGDMAFDCDVSNQAGSGDIKLVSTTLYAGGKAVLSSALLG